MPGIFTSSRIKSGLLVTASSSACAPSLAQSTENQAIPAFARCRVTGSRASFTRFFGEHRVANRLARRTRKEEDNVMEAAEVSLPRLNEPAPDFQATSTQGPVKLSDYRGKWVVFFSHPADFTPVCTTELSEFARRAPEFEKLGVQLIGLSIDSIYSHIAWIRSMEQHFGVKVKYPLIADLDTKVAQKY